MSGHWVAPLRHRAGHRAVARLKQGVVDLSSPEQRPTATVPTGGIHGRSDRDFGISLRALARSVLSAVGAGVRARVLRRAVRHRRAECHLLPNALGRDVSLLGGSGSEGLPVRRQGQPLSDPRQAAPRPGRPGEVPGGTSDRARAPPRPGPAAASPGHERRHPSPRGRHGGIPRLDSSWPSSPATGRGSPRSSERCSPRVARPSAWPIGAAP